MALPPVNVLLPNYNSVTVGEIASLEAGAFVVRANDTSSIFYNPAGVTNADRTSISGSAGVFQLSSVTAREAPTAGTSFQQIPAMFAVVVKDLFGRPNWAGGLAVSRVNAWGQEVAAELTVEANQTIDRLSYTSASSMDSWLTNIGVGYRASDKLRVGGSLDGQLTMSARDETVADQFRNGTALEHRRDLFDPIGVDRTPADDGRRPIRSHAEDPDRRRDPDRRPWHHVERLGDARRRFPGQHDHRHGVVLRQ